MNRPFLILLLSGLFPGALLAQTGSIQGMIVDASSKAPVAAARVVLVGAHLEELSHASGKFHFDRVPAGRHTIRVERIGYAPVTRTAEVRAGEKLVLRFELTPSAVEVAPVLVTGTLTRRRSDEMLSSTTALTGRQLDRNASSTVAGVVESQPGVSVSSTGPATARPVIRGLGGDRILMLEDGQRTGDMSATSGDHAVAIEPITASQIEVVRGPMSLLYGSSAMGGVVNVVKHDIPETVPEHAYGQFTAEAASAHPGGALGGSVVTGLAGLAARFEASGRVAGDLSTPIGRLHNTDVRTYGAAAGFGGGGEWGHAGGSYRFYTNRYGIPAGHAHEEEPGEDHDEDVTIDMTRHTVRGEADFHRENSLFSSVQLSAVGSHYEHREFEHGGEVATQFKQLMGSLEALARIDREDRGFNAAFGVRTAVRDIETGGELETPDTRDVTIAGFGVAEVGRGRTRFQAGLRYDWAHYEPLEDAFIFIDDRMVPTRARQFGSFSGSVGMLYELAANTRVGVNISRAYRTPDFNELYTNGPHLAANSYDVGDPDLDQETGIGADVFLRRNGDRLKYDVAFFIMRLNDYIFPSSRGRIEAGGEEGDRPRFQYTNQDARFVGGEAEIEIGLNENWKLLASASYVQAEFTTERDSLPVFENGDTLMIAASKYPPLIPPLNGRVMLRYQRDRGSAGAEVKWADDATRLGDFEEPTRGYAVLNLDAGWQFQLQGRLHSLTARVDNVFDTEYRNHLSRIKDLMPQPGRNFALLYRVTI